MTVGFIGCGNMGGALAAVAAKSGETIRIADHNPGKLEPLRAAHGCVPAPAAEIAARCDMIFLGVKPQVMRKAADEIRGALAAREGHVCVVSMAAGVTAADASAMLGGVPVLRIMPNTPAAVGEGVLLYCLGEGVTEADEAAFLALMAPAGACVRLDESKIDMGSAVTGCGPAFVCLLMEAMTDAGVRCGLPRDKALLFTLQTFAGTARLALETGKDPAALRAAVCSPAGSTIEGVAALEREGARHAMLEAVAAAYRRTRELGK